MKCCNGDKTNLQETALHTNKQSCKISCLSRSEETELVDVEISSAAPTSPSSRGDLGAHTGSAPSDNIEFPITIVPVTKSPKVEPESGSTIEQEPLMEKESSNQTK